MILDGRPLDVHDGDSVAMAAWRAGEHPANGGTLCLAGDCGNCVAVVDGVAFVRTCQVPARPGLVVRRHPVGAPPPLRSGRDPLAPPLAAHVRHAHARVVVVGAGDSGRAAAAQRPGALVLDAAQGSEVVGVYPGPTVVVRDTHGVLQVRADEVVVATGASELHPVCPGSGLRGIVTAGAARRLEAAGIALGRTVTVGSPPLRIEGGAVVGVGVGDPGAGVVGSASVAAGSAAGDASAAAGDAGVAGVGGVGNAGARHGWVAAVVLADGTRVECDTVIADLGRAPRDVLVRMATDPAVRVVGAAAEPCALPPAPVEGVVCPCSGTTVDDLHGAWERGFQHLELLKRASLCGTGTCQGGACGPYLQAFVAARSDVAATPPPFTGRPVARQLTMGEAAAGAWLDTWRRTALHGEHLALGARMDRFGGWWRPWSYGDHVAEYWAVRRGVSLGDVSTLGKLVVSGPDVVEALERIYPVRVGDLKPGRSRYVLVLSERGHLIDDGMVCRESETRFVLTFTSGGAAAAEMWVRDWIETWGLRVHVLDRTASLGAINVSGPLAAQLLGAAGVVGGELPSFLGHRHLDVAGVPCHVMRLSFTGEASYELHHPADRSVELWRALMEAGRPLGVRPHGLQALFGLRLEKGHVLVGQDTELDTTPRRVGMEWAVHLDRADKGDFLGRAALERTRPLPDARRLLGLTVETVDGRAPIEGTPILADGAVVGHVTSSFASPLLGRSVLLGWHKRLASGGAAEASGPTSPAGLTVNGRPVTVVRPPFYDPEGLRARA